MLKIENNNIVTMAYEVREADHYGELIERMDIKYPFKFMYGKSSLLPAFEDYISGLTMKDNFAFLLRPHEAYGDWLKDQVVNVPISVFKNDPERIDLSFHKGMYLALTDDQGQTHNGKLLDWSDEHATIDFNHALAGKTLHFSGSILHVRKPTLDESMRGAYIPESGVHRPS
ncbi:MAG: hypothetical protein AAGJ82_10145 [Bacteroidota bacterium]